MTSIYGNSKTALRALSLDGRDSDSRRVVYFFSTPDPAYLRRWITVHPRLAFCAINDYTGEIECVPFRLSKRTPSIGAAAFGQARSADPASRKVSSEQPWPSNEHETLPEFRTLTLRCTPDDLRSPYYLCAFISGDNQDPDQRMQLVALDRKEGCRLSLNLRFARKGAMIHFRVYNRTPSADGLRTVEEKVGDGSLLLASLFEEPRAPIPVELKQVTTGEVQERIRVIWDRARDLSDLREWTQRPEIGGPGADQPAAHIPRTAFDAYTDVFKQVQTRAKNEHRIGCFYPSGRPVSVVDNAIKTHIHSMPIWFFLNQFNYCAVRHADALVTNLALVTCIRQGTTLEQAAAMKIGEVKAQVFLAGVVKLLSDLIAHAPDTQGESFTRPFQAPSIGRAQADCEDLCSMCLYAARLIRVTKSRELAFLRAWMGYYTPTACLITSRASTMDTDESKTAHDGLHMICVLVPTVDLLVATGKMTRATRGKEHDSEEAPAPPKAPMPLVLESMANVQQSCKDADFAKENGTNPRLDEEMQRMPLTLKTVCKRGIYKDLVRVYVFDERAGGEYNAIDSEGRIGIPFVDYICPGPKRLTLQCPRFPTKEELKAAATLYKDDCALNNLFCDEKKTDALRQKVQEAARLAPCQRRVVAVDDEGRSLLEKMMQKHARVLQHYTCYVCDTLSCEVFLLKK